MKRIYLLLLLVNLLISKVSLAQCGFQATCPNTDYLNFGMGSTVSSGYQVKPSSTSCRWRKRPQPRRCPPTSPPGWPRLSPPRSDRRTHAAPQRIVMGKQAGDLARQGRGMGRPGQGERGGENATALQQHPKVSVWRGR